MRNGLNSAYTQSAQYVSEALGEQDVEQASFSSSYGPQGYGERGSISRTTVHRKLVLADEVRSLETLNAFAVLSGQKPVKVVFEPQNRMQYFEAQPCPQSNLSFTRRQKPVANRPLGCYSRGASGYHASLRSLKLKFDS